MSALRRAVAIVILSQQQSIAQFSALLVQILNTLLKFAFVIPKKVTSYLSN